MKYDPLIYGRSGLERITSCEVHDGSIDLFIETEAGVEIVTKPINYWLLTTRDFGGSTRLKGDQPFKFLKKFGTYEEYNSAYTWFKRSQNKVYTIRDPKEAAMVMYGFTYYKGMTPDQVSTLSFDIETNGRVINDDSRVFLISNTFRKNGKLERKLFAYDDYENEGAMIEAWCDWVREKDPSIMLGHNIFTFDLPFLRKVAEIHDTQMYLGRDGSPVRFNDWESKFRKDGSQFYVYHNAYVYGRELVDTLFLSYKYDIGKKYESYGLKAIIKTEGLEKEGRQHYDASKIGQMVKDPVEWAKIKQYAEDDSDDALKLFDLMIPAYFYTAQAVPKSFQQIITGATGSQINSLMVRSYLQDGHSIAEASQVGEFAGATSLGVSGLYKNVLSFDLVSLYPSIIRAFKVYDSKKDPNKNLLALADYFTDMRIQNKNRYKETKDKKYDDLQATAKIFVNSMYGFYGANGLNYNYPEGASFITQKGRDNLAKTLEYLTSKNLDYWKSKVDPEGETEDA